MKRLPPYGRRFLNHVQSGHRPTNGVNICTSWNINSVLHAVTFPPEAKPNDFDWTFLTGQEISLINTNSNANYETLKELAVLLIKSGVKSVGLVDINHPLQWFVPEVKGGVA